MDPFKFTTIGHRRHGLCSPLSEQRLSQLIDVIGLTSPRVLDLCGGKGEFAIAVIARLGGTAEVVDKNPNFLAAANKQAGGRLADGALTTVTADAQDYADAHDADGAQGFDLVMCIGARPFGSREDNLAALGKFVRPGGLLLVGEGYYRTPPEPAFLKFLGESHAEGEVDFKWLLGAAAPLGLIPLYTLAATIAEMDHYDGLYRAEIERYIAENPNDPDSALMAERIRSWRDAYYRWGRDAMGFGYYLFMTPA
ncbi:MAG: methyltransferase domain-containing protein [Myxococcales bacterium]|nr:methyltransferase domain-containing protein [Myxococcales bacterium]